MWRLGVATSVFKCINDRSGSVAIIFAFSILTLGGVTGLAVDASRVYSVSQQIGSALDAAALSAAKALDRESLTDAQAQDRALAFFNNNTYKLAAVDATFSNFALVANRSAATVELKVAVHMPTTISRILNIDSFDFIKTSTVQYASKRIELAMVLDITGSMCQLCDKLDGLKGAASEVVDVLGSIADFPGQVRVALAPYAAAVNAGSLYGAVAASGGSGGADTCVVERANGDPAAEGSPGDLGTSSTAKNPQYSCPTSPVSPLTDLYSLSNRGDLKQKIQNMNAGGGTAGHVGLAWGWYLVSPNWASLFSSASAPMAYDPKNVIKAVILMTDGEFNTSYRAGGQNSTNRGDIDSSPNQAIALCTGMKAKNIRVYTIAFQASGAAETLLRDCASSASDFFTPDTTSELKMAFHSIADQLTMMRISK